MDETFEPVEFAELQTSDRIRYRVIQPNTGGSIWRTGKVVSISRAWVMVITDNRKRSLIHRDNWATHTPQRAVQDPQ